MMMRFFKMIKLSKKDEDKQYISILIGKGTATKKIYKRIIQLCPDLQKNLYKKGKTEILFEIPKASDKKTDRSCERFARGLSMMLYYLQR